MHPTLPMARFTDPLYGSGVAYYDAQHSRVVLGHTMFSSYGQVYMDWPSAAQLPNPPTVMGQVGLALLVLGIAIAAASMPLALAAGVGIEMAVALGIGGVVAGLVSLITTMFDFSGCTPYCPQPPATPQPAQTPSQGDFNAPPDGLGLDGFNGTGFPDGGGGGGVDGPFVY